jgi:four helix bundle protein
MGIVREKSCAFAIQIVRLTKTLRHTQKEYVMSKQLLRSGTAIGALVREAEQAESRADFAHKLSIALKEANEAAYWIELLHQTTYMPHEVFVTVHRDCTELLKLLTSIIKTTRNS